MGDFGEDSDDSDGEGGMGNVNRLIMRPPGHSGKAKRGHLCFDASFETGNLGRVDLVNEYEYDLFIRPDTCNPKLRFWFNFTVDNVKQDQKVIFNIVNMSKGRNLFNENMTPIVKSSTRQKWQRIPKQHVFYYKSPSHSGHYVLSFAFGFDREDEVFQFALAAPYSYSKLQTFLGILESSASSLKGSFKREILAESVQKRRLDLITIGALDPDRQQQTKRRVIAIMARVHPGESPASFVCQGLLELLISSHTIASTLREHVIFKVIPMLNPDGVYLGNYRSTIMGIDLNRAWHVATPWCHPTIKAVIDMLSALDRSKDFQLDFVVDIHAHSSLKGCFIYGNTYEDVYRYERHILFPKLLANTTEDYAPDNTMFNTDNSKIGTSRRYLCSLLSDKVNCYTFEISVFGYKPKGSDITVPYTESSYMCCGRNLVKTILEYYHTTGAIPIKLANEVKVKRRRRARTYRSRPSTRNSSSQRLARNRPLALLHLKDLTINYESDTSMEETPCSFRYNSKRCYGRLSDRFDVQKTPTSILTAMPQYGTGRKSPPPATIMVLPEQNLSIIDFNLMARNDIEKACKNNK